MSVAGQEQVTSSGSSDILSQALFQTGLSAPVKTESENPAFELPEEHLLSCDVQTLTNSLISKMEDGPGQLPSLGIEQDAFSMLGNQNSLQENLYPRTQAMPQLAGGGGGVATSASSGNVGYGSGIAMPKLKRLENGLVPTTFAQQQSQQPFPMTTQPVVNASPVTPVTPHPPPLQQPQQQPDVYSPGESSSNGFGADIELEDLLAIDVTENEPSQPAINMYTNSSSNPTPTMPGANSGYSYTDPSSSQSLYPAQNQYNSYQQPPVSQPETSSQLPDLMTDDLFAFLGEDSSLLDDDLPSSQNNASYSPAFPSSGPQHQVQSSFHGRPPMPPPYGANSSMSNFVNTTAHPSSSAGTLTGLNVRQHQQVGGSGSGRGFFPQHGVMSRGSQPNRGSPPVRFPARQPVVSMVGSNLARPPITEPVGHDPVDSEDEDDDFTGADTYANYVPSKVKIGIPHPDSVVESSSLSSVDPPEVYFDLRLPQEAIQLGKLSALQLESVVYACQQHMNILPDGTRAGFLVGDGAGVGKGRIIAGIIFQNYLEGRKKAIWLSVSNDLRLDASRDLKDIGAKKIDIYSLNKFHYGKISGKRNGRVRKGVIFATYSSLIGESNVGGKYKTRFDQLVHWLGSQFEGVIVFDECHKAKNLVPTGAGKPSKTGMTVLQLQKRLPKARIVYCSATGASEPKNMAYMSRLGIWGKGTQFGEFQDFIKAVERRGVGAMEIVAIDMKLRGMYMARQLSFGGVTFSINEVELTEKFVEIYDASVKLWAETRRLFQEASELLDYDKQKLKTMWGQFWAAHQRFFKYMCIAAKVPETIRLAKRALEEGKCVVIGLQSTGEARTLEQLERNHGELDGFISTTKGVLETLIRRHFPMGTPEPGLGGIDWSLIDNDPTLPRSCRRKRRARDPTKRSRLWETDTPNDSNSEESSGSPEKSDSAVESSSDEGERSSEGSGSSSSESEDDDNDVNPFGGDLSAPWLQKKVKPKKRKRPWSPSSNQAEKRRRNFSIKPPPHSSKKGKTKTGFNSKNLKFENVQSPDATSTKSSPLSTPLRVPTPINPARNSQALPDRLASNHTPSPADSLGKVSQLSMPGPFGGVAAAERVGAGGQNLVDAMSSNSNSYGALPVGSSSIVKSMKEELLRKLEILSPHLPTNTLDELIDGLGGTRAVAEMTGRRGRVVSLPGGGVQYQLRSEQDVTTELLNIKEKQRFMDGDKDVAIISEAASSGISLQADRRAKNKKRRVHITLELPWSADRAIQQFGRTHRSNQVSAPEYVFLISALSGEQRFASIVAKRLQSLGALTHGDRRATESRDLSKYNVDTKYGRQALEKTVRSIVGAEAPNVKMEEYPNNFFEECCNCMVAVGLLKPPGVGGRMGMGNIDKDATTMSRFLNRILGLPVKLQNQLFSYFSDTLTAVVQKAKRTGHWDGGILDFGSSGEDVQIVDTERFTGDTTYNVFASTTELHTVEVERGMSFQQALDKLNLDTYPGEGFYTSKKVCNDKQRVMLIKAADSSGKHFLTFRPNTGCYSRSEKLNKILKSYEKVSVEEGKKLWEALYESSLTVCSHAFWQGRCRHAASGCHVGLRRKTYYMLAGSVLGVWSHIEGVFNRCPAHNQRMQIIRVKTSSKKLVGILVPKSCIEEMRRTLGSVSAQDEEGSQGNPITCD